MNVGHPIIGIDFANCRRDDILRQAEVDRLVAEARVARPTVGTLRRKVGNVLVRFGERLQGARERRLADELGESVGSLELAR
ncbi:MAG TPA: hypothetical protein VH482_23660 [Thermomicrobiales bacterium]|jgi:hypothetical protein